MSSESLHPIRRKLGPAIAWAPSHESYYILARVLPNAGSIPPLYVTQAAILDLEAHLDGRLASLPFGVLAGGYFLTPKPKQEYLLVDEIVRARKWLSTVDPGAQLAAELRYLVADVTKRRKLAVGWYIGGMGPDLKLDPETAALHRQLFPENWRVALLRDEASGDQLGAVVRFEALTDQSYAIPFSELLPEAPSRGRGGRRAQARTALRWNNYRTTEQVLPLDAAESPGTTVEPERSPSRWNVLGWLGRRRPDGPSATPAGTAPGPSAGRAPSHPSGVGDARIGGHLTTARSDDLAVPAYDPEPEPPIRVSFPIILEEGAADDPDPPHTTRRRLVLLGVAVLVLLEAFWAYQVLR